MRGDEFRSCFYFFYIYNLEQSKNGSRNQSESTCEIFDS